MNSIENQSEVLTMAGSRKADLSPAELRNVRMDIAVGLATSTDGDKDLKAKMLSEIRKLDPVIDAQLKWYGA